MPVYRILQFSKISLAYSKLLNPRSGNHSFY